MNCKCSVTVCLVFLIGSGIVGPARATEPVSPVTLLGQEAPPELRPGEAPSMPPPPPSRRLGIVEYQMRCLAVDFVRGIPGDAPTIQDLYSFDLHQRALQGARVRTVRIELRRLAGIYDSLAPNDRIHFQRLVFRAITTRLRFVTPIVGGPRPHDELSLPELLGGDVPDLFPANYPRTAILMLPIDEELAGLSACLDQVASLIQVIDQQGSQVGRYGPTDLLAARVSTEKKLVALARSRSGMSALQTRTYQSLIERAQSLGCRSYADLPPS
jgi:hypothetical protein